MGLDETYSYVVPNIPEGTETHRCIGQNIVQYELYTGTMKTFFGEIQNLEQLDIVFVVSSFGGFGSAALLPVLDYVEAITWGSVESCHVIAFNENSFKSWGLPQQIMQKFESNTISFVNELKEREQNSNFIMRRNQQYVFNPSCTSFLIDTKDISVDDYWRYIDQSDNAIQKLDCKSEYMLTTLKNTDESKIDVFISYSFADQAIADEIADRLAELKINPWIATRSIREGSYVKQIMQAIKNISIFLVLISKNSVSSEQVKNEIDRAFQRIKEGLILIPFVLDDTELDDECEYYLCRQERFFGNKPPIHVRINELVNRIKEIV